MEPQKALRNSPRREICPKDTMMLVMEVPMFAPITIGIALSKDSTPEATRPTTIDVVVDDDWIIAVAKTPITRPTTGFDVAWKIVSAKPLPKSLKEAPSSVMDNMKR